MSIMLDLVRGLYPISYLFCPDSTNSKKFNIKHMTNIKLQVNKSLNFLAILCCNCSTTITNKWTHRKQNSNKVGKRFPVRFKNVGKMIMIDLNLCITTCIFMYEFMCYFPFFQMCPFFKSALFLFFPFFEFAHFFYIILCVILWYNRSIPGPSFCTL